MAKLEILVVDDNEDFCNSFKDILEAEGYAAICATSGQSAVEQVQKTNFDMIFIDLAMPGMNGLTAIKQIKKIRPSVRVAVISGFGQEKVIQEAIPAGIEGEFVKPIDFDEVLAFLKNKTAKQ